VRVWLPIVVGLGFAAGLPAVIALGHSGSLVLTVPWVAVAAALASKSASTGSPATPRH